MEVHQGFPSYYNVLGLSVDASTEDVKRAYRKLAMQWHPDRWTRTPSLSGKAKRKFQQIQEAYSVLSDKNKRTLYDAGLYDPEDEEDEGFSDFVGEMISLMAQTRKEEKDCSLEELQKMLWDMAREFQSPPWFCGSFEDSGSSKRTTDMAREFQSPPWFFGSLEDSGSSKRTKWDSSHSHLDVSGFKMYETRTC